MKLASQEQFLLIPFIWLKLLIESSLFIFFNSHLHLASPSIPLPFPPHHLFAHLVNISWWLPLIRSYTSLKTWT